jgi:carbonic anhydrase
MAKLFVIFIVFVNCIIVDKACVPSVKPATTTQLWGYDDTDGPATWPGVCQTGTRQSPINIDIDDVQNDSNLAPLQFGNYEYYGNATFDDNGHTGM